MCLTVWKQVEELQNKLHETVTKKGVNSPEAKRVSQLFRAKMDEYKQCSLKHPGVSSN